LAALKKLSLKSAQFDIAFFDPPYASEEIYAEVMDQMGKGRLLTAEGLVVVEHRIKTPPAEESGSLRLFREVKQGESGLAFFERHSD
jgi:16S rRNA G966 N2-methylase RsmD